MEFVLRLQAQDQEGLIYQVSKVLLEQGLNIDSQSEFVDKATQKFYLRTHFSGNVIQVEALKGLLQEVLPQGSSLEVRWLQKRKIVVMATKESHVLGDLLIKHYEDKLGCEIVAVIANHDTLRGLVEKFDVPFYCIPHQGDKDRFEGQLQEVLEGIAFDFLILAKFMRILSSGFTQRYPKCIINIHHSFLPAFIGQNPYKQAHARGVKIIGATAHFATKDLDEGPIIAQDVIPVDHTYGWERMRDFGQQIETVVLSKALRLVLEDRVFVDGNKTVIL